MLTLAHSVSAHDTKITRADSHAPISVMGDHYHKSGELMFSYRFMNMQMKGVQSGSDNIDPESIIIPEDHANHNHSHGNMRYPSAPDQMSMQMHMLGAMYAPTDWITIMAMVNILNNSMSMIGSHGLESHNHDSHNHSGIYGSRVENGEDHSHSDMATSGLGDMSLSAIFPIVSNQDITVSAQLGSTIPTGNHEVAMNMMMANGMNMSMTQPYPMQLGAGVAMPFGAVNLSHYFGEPNNGFAGSLGGQIRYIAPIGENSNGWAPGDALSADFWFAYLPITDLSFSVRANAITIGQISGGLSEMNSNNLTMSPLAYRENTGRTVVRGGLGANYIVSQSSIGTFRLGGEYILPLFQDLKGIQMPETYLFTLGIQYST
ncbi:MAG: hypothetical protein Kapaf2KO_13480 [Candidatus Kapaibacteriales bacterium]